MINSKKGLSDIVTNVLIILLVLIAVGIIWRFVLPVINQSSSAVGGASDCITISVTPISCTNSYQVIKVKRNVGAGNLAGLKFILNPGKSTELTDDVTAVSGLKELETYDYDNPLNVKGTVVAVAPLISDGKGGFKVCPISPVTVTC